MLGISKWLRVYQRSLASTIAIFICSGKYYYEATCKDEGLCRIGWSTLDADLNLGTDKYGFGFGGTGKKSFNR